MYIWGNLMTVFVLEIIDSGVVKDRVCGTPGRNFGGVSGSS